MHSSMRVLVFTPGCVGLTHHNNTEVKDGPEACEVFPVSQGHPFEQHLNHKHHREHDVHVVQDIL